MAGGAQGAEFSSFVSAAPCSAPAIPPNNRKADMTALNFAAAPRPVQTPETRAIESGPFWPAVNLDHMRAARRIDNTITPERLFHAAAAAVSFVNGELKGLKIKALKKGVPNLAALAEETLNGRPETEMHYERAVYSYTAAALAETYADHAATGKSAERAEAKQQQAEDYRREGHYAVAALLGRLRIDSELI